MIWRSASPACTGVRSSAKFEQGDWTILPSDVLALSDSLVTFDCRADAVGDPHCAQVRPECGEGHLFGHPQTTVDLNRAIDHPEPTFGASTLMAAISVLASLLPTVSISQAVLRISSRDFSISVRASAIQSRIFARSLSADPNDVLEHVRVAARGHRVEEGTGLDGAAVQDARGFEYQLSAGDNGFQVVQHAAGVRRVLQDGAEKQTVAATDIDDRPEAGEAVCREDRRVLKGRDGGHPVVDQQRNVGIAPGVLEQGHAMELVDGGFAGLGRISELALLRPHLWVAGRQRDPRTEFGHPTSARHPSA